MKVAKAVILFLILIVLIVSYFYIVFWSEEWRWKFWVSGDFEDLFYLICFTFIWGALIKVVWKLIVRNV